MSEATEKSIYEQTLQEIIDSQDAADKQYKKVGNAATTNCDINQVVPQIQNMEVVRNRGGQVIGYDYKYTTPQLPDANIIAVDSNTDSGEYGSDGFGEATGGGGHSSGGGAGRGGHTRQYAGSVVIDPEREEKLENSEFVAGTMSVAYGLVSTLAKLGKNVSTELGKDVINDAELLFNTDFADILFAGANTAEKFMRPLFGVDSQGNTTMYLDEDTIGALAITARDTGFFSNSWNELFPFPEQDNDTFVISGSNITDYLTEFAYMWADERIRNNPFMSDDVTIEGFIENVRSLIDDYNQSHPDINLYELPGYLYGYQTSGFLQFVRPGSIGRAMNLRYVNGSSTIKRAGVYNAPSTPTDVNVIGIMLQRGLYNNKHYWNCKTVTNQLAEIQSQPIVGPDSDIISTYKPVRISTIGWGQGVIIPGVTTQPGATVPVDAITGADPHVVAQNLADNYSQVMGEPVLINVMDDSCNETTIKYYSVPISYSPTNLNIAAPITGGLQVSPSFNPDVQLDLPDIDLPNFINQVTKIINGSGAGEGVTIEPTINISPEFPLGPNTPSDQIPGGSLPVVVPQTGVGETPESTLPVATPTTLWHVYNPSPAEISAFGQWLWAGGFNIDTLRKILQNPMDAVIGLHAIYGTPHVSGTAPIVCGNIESPVSSRIVSSQYTSVDCGEVLLTEYFGNVFDYDPYTKISLYLPFIGIVPLDTADTMRATIAIKYNIDVFTGACNAQVIVTRDGAGGVLYQYAGNCAVQYPISGAVYNNIFSATVGISMGAAMMAAGTGGAMIPAMGLSNILHSAQQTFMANVSRASSFSGNAGAMGSKIPYLIITRPQTEMAINFEQFDGIPANKQIRLSDCSGYTKCKEVHLNVSGAYKSELDEIEQLLRVGVIL